MRGGILFSSAPQGAPSARLRQLPGRWVGRGGRSIWALIQTGALPQTLPGADGHIWDAMEFDGRQRIVKDFTQGRVGKAAIGNG